MRSVGKHFFNTWVVADTESSYLSEVQINNIKIYSSLRNERKRIIAFCACHNGVVSNRSV